MAQFAKQYGFEFICHEKGHANRKAGNERGFYTVETNFFPGREFASLEDMNRQAFEWATVRMANRPTTKTRLIPAQVFEY
jgi:transposase